VLQALAGLFKTGHREQLMTIIPKLLPLLLSLASHPSSQTFMRKLLVKLVQRIGLTYLPPRVARWRYQRGQRSILQNLGQQPALRDVTGEAKVAIDSDDEDFADVPDELEEIVEHLLCGLRDKDTVVRWSAAKGGTVIWLYPLLWLLRYEIIRCTAGVGRITERLPQGLAGEVADSVLQVGRRVLEMYRQRVLTMVLPPNVSCSQMARVTARGMVDA
jgi:hypothetical protein